MLRRSLILTPEELELAERLKKESETRLRQALAWQRVTAEVTYYRPDHPLLLQTFCHQFDDVVPELTRVRQFLRFWNRELTEAPIKAVRVSCGAMTTESEFRHGVGDFRLH